MTLKVDGTNGVLQAYDYQVLTTGFSYTFAAGTQTLVINPAGTLATGTITMPASPVDGMVITITSTQPITTLTVNANTGQSINNGGALGLAAGGSLSYVYRLTGTTWQPFSAGLPIGVGQTWQSFTGSRSAGVTYTNSTGRPIQLAISINQYATTSASSTLTVSGVVVATWRQDGGAAALCAGQVLAIVPAGGTYVVSSFLQSLTSWSELR